MSTSETQSNEDLKYHTINETKAKELKENLSDNNDFHKLEKKLKGFGNENRLRILSFLSQEDLCVHDLTALMDMSQSAISHQLSKMKNLGILDRKKDGRVVYYSLNDEALEETISQVRQLLSS
ncbi:MAG: ArsR/SmtB family transcription factor [bacterium]